MKEIIISDITLREEGKGYTLSFKEKIEIAKLLNKLNVNVIETAPITKGKTDILFLHTVAPLVTNSILSCPVGMTEESVAEAYDVIKEAKKPRLHVIVPVSTVQMEYVSHKKPAAMLETITKLVTKAKEFVNDVEVSLCDATRAEQNFLYDALKTAISAGANTVTLCDSAGEMLPYEFENFLNDVYVNVPEAKNICLSVECSDSLDMASACAVSCIKNGVAQLKTALLSQQYPTLSSIAKIVREKSHALDITSALNVAILENTVNKVKNMVGNTTVSPFDGGTNLTENFELSSQADIATLKNATEKLGYELSEEDTAKVFAEFEKISASKTVSSKELEAIIASVAMQVTPTYKLVSFVINNGNVISSTAQISLEKNGKVLQGVCVGDGPIDAAFLAIEQITGHHFELDSFQVQAVTEGRGAVGSSVVKLRYNGKPYSGKGISTDIIAASINAYINALNKICFEEGQI